MKKLDFNRKVVHVEVEGVDHSDYPDFCDAYIVYAEFDDTGEPLTEEELDELNDSDYRGELVFDYFN